MSWDYFYTKDLDPDIMNEIIELDATLSPKYELIRMTGFAAQGVTDNIKITFNAALDAAEKASLDVLVDTYETNDITQALYMTAYIQKGHSVGFEVYQKIFGLITAQGGFPDLDGGRAAYKAYLVNVRMMLKDGMPESAYREYINVVYPANLFNATTDALIRKWMRDLCIKRRDFSLYPTEADFLPVLTAIETAPEGTI